MAESRWGDEASAEGGPTGVGGWGEGLLYRYEYRVDVPLCFLPAVLVDGHVFGRGACVKLAMGGANGLVYKLCTL